MLNDLKTGKKVTGAKQVGRALGNGRVVSVYLAQDADPHITEPIIAQCEEQSIPVETVATMAELGAACGIAVGSAVAAVVK